MRTTVNQVHVEGFLFSADLQNRTSRKTGQPFIMGDINVATDAQGTNVVPIHFTYVTPTFRSGNPNSTYQFLQSVIDGDVPMMESAGSSAARVRVDGDIETNDFVTRTGEMASPMRIRGSFVHQMASASNVDRPAAFEADMLITSAVEKEPENDAPYVTLSGFVFNFRGDMLPVSFYVRSEGGMNYFVDANISNKNPMFTKVFGEIVSRVISHETTTETAFGEPIVNVTTSNRRSYDVYTAAAEPYEFDESGITRAEIKEKLAAREEYLADVRKRHDEYVAERDGVKPTKSFEQPAAQVATDDDDDDDAFPF